MGTVVRIAYSFYWERTFFVQELDHQLAKEKAYNMFKKLSSCVCPDTVEEAESDDSWVIEILAEVEQIII